MEREKFEFKTIEQFFEDNGSWQGYRNWQKAGRVNGYEVKGDSISLYVETGNNEQAVILINFPMPDTFRLRFHPDAKSDSDYPDGNTRSIVKDSFRELSDSLDPVNLDVNESDDRIHIWVKDQNFKAVMKLEVQKSVYRLFVYQVKDNGSLVSVSRDGAESVYFKKRVCIALNDGCVDEYSVIQSREMPSSARYVGFGEKGGTDLSRNGARLTYFNYDNMRYKQIYRNGPLDVREPLYDSNPFFIELNGVPGEDVTYGIFIDNSSATYVDMGSYNHDSVYLFGSLYGTLDYYFFLGKNAADVIRSYTSFVGTTKLKPRFVLGNHQGCYGYENEYDLHDVVNGYRGNNIPLDGLHVDVDIQVNYGTFTMNENKFSRETFDNLERRGIKCSTNITPVVSYTNLNYKTFQSGDKNNVFVNAARVSDPDRPGFYKGGVYYGGNRGTFGTYPDFGSKDVRLWWGQQYRLLYSRGLKMVWQDMTTPCIPDPNENMFTEIYSERDNANLKIGEHITGDMRSYPFDLLVTDNFFKKYDGETVLKSRILKDRKAPAARVRNLSSYNLHKATYHGLNFIWTVNKYTFTTLGDGLTIDQSREIINGLRSKNVLSDIDAVGEIYQVNKMDFRNSDLGIPQHLGHFWNEVVEILEQSVELERRRKNKRNFIIGRGGFSGTHRFAGLWTGDNSSSWDFLKINITQVLALGMTGQSMAGQDIGGFERENDWEQWVDPELFIRWVGAGAFLPWFRNHYIRKGIKLFQEPYKFQDHISSVPQQYRYIYEAVLPVTRYYIQLRYRLIQLFYDCMFENTLIGIPITRPLFLVEDKDKSILNDKISFLNNQFFVGKDLMVAPVIEKEEWGTNGVREIYLPAGSNWYTFMNNRRPLHAPVNGGSVIKFDAHINSSEQHIPFITPMFVREGGIIPTVELEQYVGQLHDEGKLNPVTFNIYPGRKGSYDMYADDGISRSSSPADTTDFEPEAKGEYRHIRIESERFTSLLQRVSLRVLHNNYVPAENFCFIALLHDPSMPYHGVRNISITSENFAQAFSGNIPEITGGTVQQNAEALWNSGNTSWYYNPEIHATFVKVFFPEELRHSQVVNNQYPSLILNLELI
jgi:alpha-glucosidase (family GH31 glycosyl hydrolase)